MSSSSSSNRPAALGALLWIFLIIGAAGLVITMLSVAGSSSIGSTIGIILLVVGIVGAVLFAYISSYFSPAASAKEAAVALAPVAEAPVAEAPVAEAVIVETPTGEALIVETPTGEMPVADTPISTSVADISDATPVADIPVADISIADKPVAAAVIVDTSAGEMLLVEDVIAEVPVADIVAETPTGEMLVVGEVVAEVPVAEAVIIETPVADSFSSEPASPPPAGFSFVSHSQSFNWRGAGAPGTDEWVFALASSPTVTHTYRVTAREGASSSAWYPGGGIVDIMIDSVPTGQLMVVANEKKTREDVADGNLYRLEMEITSDGLAPATIASQVTVNGVALK
jgi:hypothetical protein